MPDNVVKLRPTRPCPICGKTASQQFHPFCSARCADIDLNRWLSGTYVIPGNAAPGGDEESDASVPEDGGGEDDDV